MNDGAEVPGKGARDRIVAADALHHGGLLVPLLSEEQRAPHVFIEQRLHVEHGFDDTHLLARSRRNLEARAAQDRGAAREFVGFVQVTVAAQEREHAVFVRCIKILVERALLDALGKKFGDVAASIAFDASLRDGRAAIGRVILQQGGARGVHLDLERNLEVAAVLQDGPVRGRNATGAHVLVVAVFPVDRLYGAVHELDLVAFASGPDATAGASAGFKECDVKAEILHLPGSNQAGGTSTEHHDLYTLPGIGRGGDGTPLLAFGRKKPQRLHGGEGRPIAAKLADARNEIPSRETHAAFPPVL